MDDMPSDIRAMITAGDLLFVFDVNEEGEMADGEPLNGQLSEDFVAAGYGKSLLCVMRYPNGGLGFGHRSNFTAAGVEFLRQEIDAGRF